MAAYYSEFDPQAAEWLRQLIRDGLIPEGDVDERDIREVQADDVRGYSAVHLFAGIGGWAEALRLAGWPDDRPVWTGSCPCQPFSAAGKRKGQADDRHLWPAMFRLVRECRPDVVFGEQVEGAIRHGWLDGVCADLEGEGYAVGAAVLGAHSAGAPHIRQRLYWVADANGTGSLPGRATTPAAGHGNTALTDGHDGDAAGVAQGDTGGSGLEVGRGERRHPEQERPAVERAGGELLPWSAFDLLPCTDGKSRRVEPGTFPLVARLPAGVVPSGDPSREEVKATAEGRFARLRGYGNAIVPQVAAEFVRAWLEVEAGVTAN